MAGFLSIKVQILVLAPSLQPSALQAEALQLDVLETEDLRLIYLDPLQTYLVPHTAHFRYLPCAFAVFTKVGRSHVRGSEWTCSLGLSIR